MKYTIILMLVVFSCLTARAQTVDDYLTIGKSDFVKKDYDRAILSFSKVISLDPEHSFAYYLRSTCYAEQNKYLEACADMDTAIAIEPEFDMFYAVRGEYLCDLRKFHEALIDLNRAVALDSTQAYTYFYRAKAHRNLGNLSQSLQDITRACTLNPNRSEYYYVRGEIFRKLDNRDSAIASYTTAYEKNEGYFQGIILASTMLNMGEPETALTWINWSIDRFGRQIGNIGTRGEVLFQLRRYTESLQDFSEVIERQELKKDNRVRSAYHLRGLCHDSMGNRELALKDFNKAILIDSVHGLSYSGRGSIYMRAGKYKQALQDFNRAIQYAPEEGVTYYLRGLLYANHFKKKEAACQDFMTANELQFKNAVSALAQFCDIGRGPK